MITLRALEPEDLPLLYAIENDRRLWPASSTSAPYSRYALGRYIAEGQTLASCGQLRQAICLAPGGEAIGLIDLFDHDARHRRAETAVVLLEPYRGRGYAAQALARLCDDARGLHHLHTLYAYVPESNTASLRLYTGAGFACRGTLPDWVWDGRRFEAAHLLVKTLGAGPEDSRKP